MMNLFGQSLLIISLILCVFAIVAGFKHESDASAYLGGVALVYAIIGNVLILYSGV